MLVLSYLQFAVSTFLVQTAGKDKNEVTETDAPHGALSEIKMKLHEKAEVHSAAGMDLVLEGVI
jgi:hypothetical protein